MKKDFKRKQARSRTIYIGKNDSCSDCTFLYSLVGATANKIVPNEVTTILNISSFKFEFEKTKIKFLKRCLNFVHIDETIINYHWSENLEILLRSILFIIVSFCNKCQIVYKNVNSGYYL